MGYLRTRKVSPKECLQSKKFPAGMPVFADQDTYRMAGNAVPVGWFTELCFEVDLHLQRAKVSTQRPSNEGRFCTELSGSSLQTCRRPIFTPETAVYTKMRMRMGMSSLEKPFFYF